MSAVAIDASAALSWLASTQATASALAFLTARESTRFVTPYVFDLEVRNSLLRLERRGVLSSGTYVEAVLELESLDLERRPPLARQRVWALADLARRERISLFDAHYLDLSLNEGWSLASLDGGLLSAARRHEVNVHDLRNFPRP